MFCLGALRSQIVCPPRPLNAAFRIITMAERVPNGSGHAVNGGGGRGRGISSGAQRRPRNRNHAGRGRGKPDATPGPPRDSLLSRIGGIEPAGHLAAVASVPGSSRQFSSTGILEGYTSGRRFAETSLSPTMKAAVPFEFMSEIQSATIDVRPCLHLWLRQLTLGYRLR